MEYEDLKSLIRRRVGDEGVAQIISIARDGRPIPTVLCLVRHADGTFTATRGDLRTVARPVLDTAGQELRFVGEWAVCAWAWSDLEPGLGETPVYSAEDVREALASGDRQRARRAERLRQWRAANGLTSD